MARKLLYWYKRDGRVIRAADPRNLFRMLDATLDEGQKLSDVLTMDLVERVYRQYPLSLEKDATGYSVTEVTEEEFRSSFQEEAAKHGVPAERADELAGQALAYFRAQGRFLRPVDAGNLFAMADGAGRRSPWRSSSHREPMPSRGVSQLHARMPTECAPVALAGSSSTRRASFGLIKASVILATCTSCLIEMARHA